MISIFEQIVALDLSNDLRLARWLLVWCSPCHQEVLDLNSGRRQAMWYNVPMQLAHRIWENVGSVFRVVHKVESIFYLMVVPGELRQYHTGGKCVTRRGLQGTVI